MAAARPSPDCWPTWARDNPATLARLMLDADPDGFAKFLPQVRLHLGIVMPLLRNAAKNPATPPKEADALVEGQLPRDAAIALMRLGDDESAWAAYGFNPDPNTRTFLIHKGDQYGVPLSKLLDRLRAEPDVATLRGLLLAVGRHSDVRSSAALVREAAKPFLSHSDAGVMGAAEWLAKQLPGEPPAPRSPSPPVATRSWYVTSEGQVMVIVDGERFQASIAPSPSRRRRRRSSRCGGSTPITGSTPR